MKPKIRFGLVLFACVCFLGYAQLRTEGSPGNHRSAEALNVYDANNHFLGTAMDTFGTVYIPSLEKIVQFTTSSVPTNCVGPACTPVFGYPSPLYLYYSGINCTGTVYTFAPPAGGQQLFWYSSGLYTLQAGGLLPYPTNASSYQYPGSGCVNQSLQVGGSGNRSVILEPYSGTLLFTLPVAFPLRYGPG